MRVVPKWVVPFWIVCLRCSSDCTIETVDWQVNYGIRFVAYDAASPHSYRVNFAVAHDLEALISLDREDGIESFVSFETGQVIGWVSGSVIWRRIYDQLSYNRNIIQKRLLSMPSNH